MEAKLAALEEKFTNLEREHQELSKKVATADNANEKHDEEESVAPTSRVRILHSVNDSRTNERKDVLPDGTELSPKVLENTKPYAFTLRKYLDELWDNEIEIHDTDLRDLLRSQLRHYPGHVLIDDNVTLVSPFEPIILNWDKLEKLADTVLLTKPDDQSHCDLKLLLKIISESSGKRQLDQYFKYRVQNIEQRRVTFETLWTIFPPGEKVFGCPFQKQEQIFIVQDNLKPWPDPESRGKSKPWKVACWSYDWNGQNFLRTLLHLKIDRFEGAKLINSLPFYPLYYHEDSKRVENDLEERGRQYRKLCIAKKGEQMFHYKGEAIFSKKGVGASEVPFMDYSSDSDGEYSQFSSFHSQRTQRPNIAKSSQVDSTVMVDYLSYNRYGPADPVMGALVPVNGDVDCNCLECRNNDELMKITRRNYDKATGKEPECDWIQEQLMLCPPRVLGYVLRDKQWAQLQVSIVKKDPNENSDAYFNKLQLMGKNSGKSTKDLLMNLVKNHGGSGGGDDEDDVQVEDIVVNKGKGLVILLYGPPGVGKTTTAETVAIAAKKPLFPVSVADVGTKAKYVENNLERIFDLASTWEAILLIDEADVFLESRSKGAGNNTERNALVSVFLRVLEYYQGILFLTTNQIAQFDVAVQSRIHIALKYEPLSEEQTTAIFKQFLNQLKDKNKIKSMTKIENWIESDLLRRKASFDGRQIRNIVSCAVSLARAEGRSLEKDDLITIVDIVRDFKTEFQLQFDRYMRSQEGKSRET